MKDKKLEDNIKKAEDFIEIWDKFHHIFKNALSEAHVTEEKDDEFIATKDLVNSRYEDLMDSLEVKPLKRFLISPTVYNILALDRISTMSDERLKIVAEDWSGAFEFLYSLLNRLRKKKKRIEGFNKFFFIMKKKFNRVKPKVAKLSGIRHTASSEDKE